METTGMNYVIVKGFIDAKDDRGRKLYASILALVSRRETKYATVLFAKDELRKTLDWQDLLALHRDRLAAEDRDPALYHDSDELENYIKVNTVLNTVAKTRNSKGAEQAISRFCLDHLHQKAVTFIDFVPASDHDIALFETAERETQVRKDEKTQTTEEVVPDEMITAPTQQKTPTDIYIRCEPVLDPVGGIAMNELKVGDHILGKLPEESVFYKLLVKNFGSFDGIVTAKVTGILSNEFGTATVSLELADGVLGVMKLSGKVRVKVVGTASLQKNNRVEAFRQFNENYSSEIVFVAAGVTVTAAAVLLLYYILR